LLSLLPIISFHMISLSPCRAHWLRLRRAVTFVTFCENLLLVLAELGSYESGTRAVL
jgi:hypothetical protein